MTGALLPCEMFGVNSEVLVLRSSEGMSLVLSSFSSVPPSSLSFDVVVMTIVDVKRR